MGDEHRPEVEANESGSMLVAPVPVYLDALVGPNTLAAWSVQGAVNSA